MNLDVYDICSDCSEVQCIDVMFDAVHPISQRKFTVEYCKHLDMILTDDIKHLVGKLTGVTCMFLQKTKEEELHG